jgi:hypothetical protein
VVCDSSVFPHLGSEQRAPGTNPSRDAIKPENITSLTMALRKKQTKEEDRRGSEEEEEEEASSTSSSEAGMQESNDDNDDDDDGIDSGSEEGSDGQMDADEISSDEEEGEGDDDDDDGDSDDDDGEEEEGSDDDDEESVDDADADAVDGEKVDVDDGNARDGGGGEQCTFDLANLLAFNTHQINAADLYRVGGGGGNNDNAKFHRDDWYGASPTIQSTTAGWAVSESLLLAKAAEGTTQLLRELWRLPTERTDAGTLARLPTASSAGTKLPRSLVSWQKYLDD